MQAFYDLIIVFYLIYYFTQKYIFVYFSKQTLFFYQKIKSIIFEFANFFLIYIRSSQRN